MSEQLKQNGFKPCPFCGGKGVLREMDGDVYVRCDTCGGRGPNNFFNHSQAAQDWNRRTEQCPISKAMPVAEFYAKHNRLISIIQNVAGAKKAALVICLENKTYPMISVHQYKILGGDQELNQTIADLLAYCMTWLDDTKGIKA